MPAFDTDGPVVVRVRIPAGRVVLQTGESATTVVEVEALRDDDATRSAVASTRIEHVERAGGTHEIAVGVPERSGRSLFRRGGAVLVKVAAPPGVSLAVAGSSADVDARGQLGNVDVKTSSGDVVLDEVAGSLQVGTASGDVSVAAFGSRGEVASISGDVLVRRASGSLAVSSVSGDVIVRDALGPLTIQSVSGDIVVDSFRAGPVAVKSVSGDVHLAAAAGLGLLVDASSVSGDMRSELEVEPTASAAGLQGEPVEVRVRTVSGDVSLGRS